MIESAFKAVLGISLMGIIVTLMIAALKLILGKKLSAKWNYAIWILLVIRLAIPISLSSPYSIFNILQKNKTIASISSLQGERNSKYVAVNSTNKAINTVEKLENTSADISKINKKDNFEKPNTLNKAEIKAVANSSYSQKSTSEPITKKEMAWRAASYIWFLVFLVLLIYISISYIKLSFEIRSSRNRESNELETILAKCAQKLGFRRSPKIIVIEHFDTPFVFGIIKPVIIVPLNIIKRLNESEKEYILMHEMMHIKWRDNIVNVFSILLQILHWFNPIVWCAISKMKNDCEIACDARVIERISENQHKEYASTLLQMARHQNNYKLAYSGLAFGESNIKRRVKDIMNFKKNSLGTTVLAVTIIVTAAGFVNTNAITNHDIANVTKKVSSKAVAKSAVKNDDYVIPYSNQRLLIKEDVSSLNANQLFYARNEIYARHGYVFSNEECIKYFENEKWYHKNNKFNVNSLSSIEKANIAFLQKAEKDYAKKPIWEKFQYTGFSSINVANTVLAGQKLPISKNKKKMEFNYKCNVTYNETLYNNRKYPITLKVADTSADDSGVFELNIAGKTVKDQYAFGDGTAFTIVQFNKKDNMKYIVVRCSDFDDWRRLYVYTFDGTSIKKVGSMIMATNNYLNYDQNGILETATIGRVLQSHICPSYYKITKGKMSSINLKYTPYSIYSSNKMQSNKLMLKTNLTLYKSYGSKKVAVKLHAGDIVYQVCNYGNDYICLKTAKGNIGWFRLYPANAKNINGTVEGTNKDANDVFAAIVQFD